MGRVAELGLGDRVRVTPFIDDMAEKYAWCDLMLCRAGAITVAELAAAGVASVLIIVFNGDISKLIPLYAFGVFMGFTFSQAGMVVHHIRLKEPHWKPSLVINAIGATTTGSAVSGTPVVVTR